MNSPAAEQSGLRQNWTKLAQVSVWMTSIIFTFQSDPPRHSPAIDGESWVRLAQFLLAIILGLAIGFVTSRRKSRTYWRRASAACLVVALIAFFGNKSAVDNWTCDYDARGPMVIGATLTREGADYLRNHQHATCRDMLVDVAGSNVTLWTPREISHRHSILVGLFLLTVIAFSLTAVLMLESLRPTVFSRARA